ncbi:MAG: hypothetical protein H5T44_03160 [Thermoplasmatales archaeon]|nr:hypothetical protein [Thermoplasmatales archaeon]
MDNKGRIPFSLLGVFLLLGAIFTSSIISNLQKEYSSRHVESLESSSLKYALLNFEQEMVRILRYAGLEAMKVLGENPVFYLPKDDEKIDYELARKYGGSDPYFESLDKEKIMKYNKNWVRDLINNTLSEYLEEMFKNDKYKVGDYAINVIEKPSYENIRLDDIRMKLDRNVEFLGVNDKEYTIYWKTIVDGMKIEIHDLEKDKKYEKELSISAIIPSRLPLLMELSIDYENNLTGEFKPLMTFVTVMGEGITEIRALLQYGGGGINNIVSNRWLIPITNLGMVIIQFLIFNSVDIVSVLKTTVNLGKLFLDDSFSFDEPLVEDFFKDFCEFDKEKVYNEGISEIKKNEQKIENDDKKINPVLKIAQELLYERIYVYNLSTGEFNNKTEYKGYEFEEKGKKYLFIGISLNTTVKNPATLEKINETVENVYRVNLGGAKIVKSFNEWYEGTKKGERVGEGNWEGEIKWVDKELKKGDLPSLPYSENVKFELRREEYYEYFDRGKNETVLYTVTHHASGEFEFRIPMSEHDIKDVFHKKILDCREKSHEDDNFETALKLFVNEFVDFRENCFINLNGENEYIDREYKLDEMVDVSWLKNGGEIFKELERILEKIEEDKKEYESKMIENIDANNIPNIDSINMEREFLLQKFRENKKNYYSFTEEYYKEGDLYKSAGAKAILEGVKWYLDSIEKSLSETLDLDEEVSNKVKDKIGKEMDLKKLKDLKIDFSFLNIGLLDMKIKGEWNESISIGVDCDPDFQEKVFKNTCLFPLGLPLLPTPITPWVVTINSWYVEIKGSHSLTLLDSNESIPNQLFGYENQVLKRRNETVENPVTKSVIGYNREINFSFKTLFFAITPPTMPIADLWPPEATVEKNG